MLSREATRTSPPSPSPSPSSPLSLGEQRMLPSSRLFVKSRRGIVRELDSGKSSATTLAGLDQGIIFFWTSPSLSVAIDDGGVSASSCRFWFDPNFDDSIPAGEGFN